MAIIKTLDNFDESSELAPTQANFPALQHFFPCTETTELTLTDSVGSVVLTPTTLGFGTNHVVPSTTGDVANTSGSWASLASGKKILFVTMGDYGTGGSAVMHIGTSLANPRISIIAASGILAVRDDDEAVSDPGMTFAAGVIGVAATVTPGATPVLVTSETDVNGANWAANAGINSSGDGFDATVDYGDTFSWTIPKLYSLMIFHFTTLPTDIEQAVTWMYNEHVNNGNKVIYPGWKGRS